jgi:hypothetical protein
MSSNISSFAMFDGNVLEGGMLCPALSRIIVAS